MIKNIFHVAAIVCSTTVVQVSAALLDRTAVYYTAQQQQNNQRSVDVQIQVQETQPLRQVQVSYDANQNQGGEVRLEGIREVEVPLTCYRCIRLSLNTCETEVVRDGCATLSVLGVCFGGLLLQLLCS